MFRVHKLTMPSARDLVQFARTAPVCPEGKLAIVQLDKATPAALHVLLKTLEELPAGIKVILISESMPLETVVSRVQVYRFGLLSDEAVANVLIEKRKIEPELAKTLAAASRGQVSRALAQLDDPDGKQVVLDALEAFREKNPYALDHLAPRWMEEHTELLAIWCRESITKRWSIFGAETEIPGQSTPLRILLALRPNIRPRLVVRSSLMSVLQGS